ncbi:MAG: 3'-5' exonuclease [Polyangiaceae bacterium]|nr:3'-5' exonuclease [Polyangiaceae bacterium]
MTGLDPARDRIVELCIERVRGTYIEGRLHTLVRPENLAPDKPATGQELRAVAPSSSELAQDGHNEHDEDTIAPAQSSAIVGSEHIHGITAEALAFAPTFANLTIEVTSLLGGAVLIAHGAFWDVAFLRAEIARAGKGFRIPFYIDTLNLSRRAFDLPRHSLGALRAHFGIDSARAHRADADVAALRAVWERCVQVLQPKTPRDAWQVRVAERRARDQIIAECNHAIARGEPVTVVWRPNARPAEPMTMVLVEIRTGLDPPRVIGYQLPGRGRRELRADRILRIEFLKPES